MIRYISNIIAFIINESQSQRSTVQSLSLMKVRTNITVLQVRNTYNRLLRVFLVLDVALSLLATTLFLLWYLIYLLKEERESIISSSILKLENVGVDGWFFSKHIL